MHRHCPLPLRCTLSLVALGLALALPLSAHAAAWDACFNALKQQQAVQAVQEAEALLHAKPLPHTKAYFANLCLGRAWLARGELKKALPPLREAARLAGNAEQRAGAQSWLGSTFEKMGQLDAAGAAYQAQLVANAELGDASKQASALNNLAGIAKARKQYAEALSLFTRSLVLQTDEGAKAVVLNNMASVHFDKGEYALAVDVQQQAIAIDRRRGDRQALASDLLNLGETYRKLRQWKDCGAALDEGLTLARANGDRYWEGVGLAYFGRAFRDDMQPAKARENFNAALQIFRQIGAAGNVADAEQSLAELER